MRINSYLCGMKYNNRFVRDPDGRWYIDLPDYPGTRDNLEMVCGADTLLNILAQGDTNVHLTFSDTPITDGSMLVKSKDGADEGGAYYWVDSVKGVDYSFELWLCDVTKYVFGSDILPDKIFYR